MASSFWMPLQAEDRQEVLRALDHLALFGLEAAGAQDAVEQPVAGVRVIGDTHIVQHGQVREQADVLEGAADARSA